jgi:hypothetical protein
MILFLLFFFVAGAGADALRLLSVNRDPRHWLMQSDHTRRAGVGHRKYLKYVTFLSIYAVDDGAQDSNSATTGA